MKGSSDKERTLQKEANGGLKIVMTMKTTEEAPASAVEAEKQGPKKRHVSSGSWVRRQSQRLKHQSLKCHQQKYQQHLQKRPRQQKYPKKEYLQSLNPRL